jgi:hypothetical protein
LAKHTAKKGSAEQLDSSPSGNRADPSERAPHSHEEESGFAAGLRRFSRRLATFGLGEAQKPLLTEEIWSVDAEGKPR